MKNHQTRMDVIGNNIANVNTTGFKSSRANFQDMVYQMVRATSGPSGATAGTSTGSMNPSQVGTGMSVANIDTDMTQGALQNTGRTLDCAIQGNGWFQVKDSAGNLHYTRNGVLYIDANGTLVDANGNLVCGSASGVGISIATPSKIGTISIAKDGTITATPLSGGATLAVTGGPITLYGFANQGGLKEVGQNYYNQTTASGTAGAIASTNIEIDSGYLEMSNVNLTDQFVNMITTQRGYEANGKMITTSDQMLQDLLNIKQ